MTTKGRLRRLFPAQAVKISMKAFREPDFQASVAETLAKMSHQSVAGTKPKARKADHMHDEERDTRHPGVVTKLFMGFLGPVGDVVDVTALTKHTREEVLWQDALAPWRRSAMWLLIRVGLQITFSRPGGRSRGSDKLYKEFMVFLMSGVLKEAQQFSLSSDILFAMNAKLARRLRKLDSAIRVSIRDSIREVMLENGGKISGRWLAAQDQDAVQLDMSQLSTLDVEQDTLVSLPALDEYIKGITMRHVPRNQISFSPSSSLIRCSINILPCLTNHDFFDDEYATFNLQRFEAWVSSSLHQWTKTGEDHVDTFRLLGTLIVDYHSLARSHYSKNPEGISVMILTILEIWVACDEAAIHACPLLSDYDPGIQTIVLQSLVFPFREQMERLRLVEAYLAKRYLRTSHSLFQDLRSPNCFALRYFHSSSTHRALLEEITDRAKREREEKLLELDRLKRQYADLMRLHDERECENETTVDISYNVFGERCETSVSRHKVGCQKCRCKSDAENLCITIHEWPLPRDSAMAKAVVFELQVPSFLASWRDTTMFLLLDVLKFVHSPAHTPDSWYHLSDDPHLCRKFSTLSVPTRRIGLLSPVKPHVRSHRVTREVATAVEDDVCLQNALNYQYYDRTSGCFAENFESTHEIPHGCTYQLPERSTALQKFIFRPAESPNGPPHNVVIASQSDCPDGMSLGEYKELATLALGTRIQWLNILLQLAAPCVDLRKSETVLAVWQCIYQAGPVADGCSSLRESHAIAGEHNVATKFLEVLYEALQRIKGNWESAQALSIFATTATRVLSLSSTPAIQNSSTEFLDSARGVCFGWVCLLRDKARDAVIDKERTEMISKCVEVALICTTCFDVDDHHLATILDMWKPASVLIQIAIVIRDGKRTLSHTPGSLMHILSLRFQRLLHRSYPLLAKNHHGLDDAIGQAWSAYQAGTDWRAISNDIDYWVFTKTAPTDGGDTLSVHYNLLTGELLVNGQPLDRLPKRYEDHPLYFTLFGRSAVEVMPSTVPGMQFSTKRECEGHVIHLGLHAYTGRLTDDLLVRASTANQAYDIIPAWIFYGNFPTFHVDEFVHWYDWSSGSIQFRSIDEPWNSMSLSNWTLSRNEHGSQWRLKKSGMSLASLKSNTTKVLGHMISPLAPTSRIHTTLQPDGALVDVEIPTLRLGFSLEVGGSLLDSKQFRGMSVDSNQSLGCLIGLGSKLLLKHRSDGSRLVLVPEGRVSCARHGIDEGHISVSIERESTVTIHRFFVDDYLGRLNDNGSLHSKLVLAHMHALTSFCLPDPLTNKTGTEQALSILTSGAVRSFDQLMQSDIDTLEQIARLSPGRSYYPPHERVMQTVTWSRELGFLSQHGGLYKATKSISAQELRSRVFYPNCDTKLPKLDHIEDFLLERDCIRSSTFRVSEFGAEDFTSAADATYEARDRDGSSARRSNSYAMSSTIYSRLNTSHWKAASRDQLWRAMCQVPSVHGPCTPSGSMKFNYDAALLTSGDLVLSHWLCLHQQLSSLRNSSTRRFNLMIWLSSLAFSKNADLSILQVMALFYTTDSVREIEAPSAISFHPSEGYSATKSELQGLVRSRLISFSRCSPEARLPCHHEEKDDAFDRRRERAFQSNQDIALNHFVNSLHAQWPCEVPSTPDLGRSADTGAYINVEQAMTDVKTKFGRWFDNLRLYCYLTKVADNASSLSLQPIEIKEGSLHIPPRTPRDSGFVSIEDLFARPAPCLDEACEAPENRLPNILRQRQSPGLNELIQTLGRLGGSKFETAYVEDLQDSQSQLQARDSGPSWNVRKVGNRESLQEHSRFCEDRVDKIYEALESSVSPGFFTSFAPRTSRAFFLGQLSRRRWQRLGRDWRTCIVQYGVAVTALRRADRLVKASALPGKGEMIDELQNVGHSNWDPLEYPESLLLEVESGITIREAQERIAAKMRSPPSGHNAVMQLNMGEGKSSVIAPMVAAALADGTQLVRVVAAKPQSKQMAQMLISKLGGLLHRRVYYMPFSRALRLDEAAVQVISKICRECMEEGGVMLVQPEHLLSFQLMGPECCLSGNLAVGRSLLDVQAFLDNSSRDIVDESDENFNVKFELIYTMGTQRPIEMSPQRWVAIQQVLDLVRRFVPDVARELPSSLEVKDHVQGAFPRIRVTRPEAGHSLLRFIGKHVCRTGLDGFPIARQPRHVRDDVYEYITKFDLTPRQVERVENAGSGGFWTDSTKSTLLLLRGLLAGGILTFALGQKRWRVNYGLVATRSPATKLAVPYRAKDNPTPRSEFSHPDVVIVLTSLCYYYGGLNDEELFTAVGHLQQSDQNDIEYQAWIKDAPKMPRAFAHLQGINLRDRRQCQLEIFPSLRTGKSVVDYFLSKIVFPKEMKEFPHKLSASGWDIGKTKRFPTTGFSGTNDSRILLPLDVHYLNLPSQKFTNALVLHHLLQPENSVAVIPAPSDCSPSTDAERLLTMVVALESPTQVILDVGAQILELDNLGVARTWLRFHADCRIEAVVYFDDQDELSIVDRRGHLEALQTSPYAAQLDVCLIYLDEAHTRGTDLKLPQYYRAAVTLGAGLTKDRLVQGTYNDPAYESPSYSRLCSLHAYEKAREGPDSGVLCPGRN